MSSAKKFLICGASSGIGLATAQVILANGDKIVGVSRDLQKLEAAFRDCDHKQVQLISADLSTEVSDSTLDEIGEVSGVVHSAGKVHLKPIRNLTQADFDEVFRPHAFGPILLTAKLLKKRQIKKQGSVVFVSSLAALHSPKALTAYSMAKASINLAVQNFTSEYSAKSQVRFNAVLPGLVATPLIAEATRVMGDHELKALAAPYPLGMGSPQDVAELICFLLSEKSRWMTGSSIVIDGGRSAV